MGPFPPYHKSNARSGATTIAGVVGGDSVVREFHDNLGRSPDMAVAVAAIKALTQVTHP